MIDYLAKAITAKVWPVLKADGFLRHGKRNFVRADNGVAQRLYFQLSEHGSLKFVTTASANLVASNDFITLQPGFRLCDGIWMPSRLAEDADSSVEKILRAIQHEALPFFERARTLEGFMEILDREKWGASHHLAFERGVVSASLGKSEQARMFLNEAIRLYREDGREWCADYVKKATVLLAALDAATADRILDAWYAANAKVHGV